MKSPHLIKRSIRLSSTLLLASTFLFTTALVCSAQKPDPSKKPGASTAVKSSVDKCVSGKCVNGKGKKIYANGDTYEGDFVQGKRSGRGKFIANSGVVYTGQFAIDQYNGEGKFEGLLGDIYEGTFVNGKKEGTGTEQGIFGDVYTGNFSNNEYNGKGKVVNPDGSAYEGDFVDGKLEGQATLTYPSGDYYTGAWKNFERNGYGKEYIKATNKAREGFWKDGVLVGTSNSKPVLPTSTSSNIGMSNSAISDTTQLLRDTLNGKSDYTGSGPLAYKLTNKKSGESLFYNIEFINDGGKLAFRWNELTKSEKSDKLVITDRAIASASKWVNIFSPKHTLAPDTEITFILSQTLYQELKTKKEISLNLGKRPQRLSFNYNLNALIGTYTTKTLKVLDLQGDEKGTSVRILDDPICPLIVDLETSEYRLELTNSPPKTSKTEAEWRKLCEPFIYKMVPTVNTKKDDAAAKQIYADFEAATKYAGTSTSVREARMELLQTMHRSNISPLMQFVREKLKTLDYTEAETIDILSSRPRVYYV